VKPSDPKPDPDAVREAKRIQAEREERRSARGRARMQARDAYRARLAESPGQVIGRGPRWSRRQLAAMNENES
jgi:hypothetical protein